MIDLSKTTITTYRKKVAELYAQLEKSPMCGLLLFEHRYRRIAILNLKINNILHAIKTSEVQKDE